MTSTNNNNTNDSAKGKDRKPVIPHINEVTLMGTLEDAPVISKKESGQRAFIRLATIEFFEDENGQMQSVPNWHTIVTFSEKLVKKVEGLKPGSLLYIKGRNRSSKYEQDGVPHYRYEVQPLSITIVS